MDVFELDGQLANDTLAIGDIGLCRLLLMNDRRFPWLILVPRRADITEIFELPALDQTVLTYEIALVSEVLKDLTDCHKINVAALGNQVSQLHIHIIARTMDDVAWPGPVWGKGVPEPYPIDEASDLSLKVCDVLRKAYH